MAENKKEKNPTFYGSQQAASIEIDRVLGSLRTRDDLVIIVNQLVLEVTRKFAVSQSMVRKRVDLWLEVNKEEFDEVNGEIGKRGAINVPGQKDTN